MAQLISSKVVLGLFLVSGLHANQAFSEPARIVAFGDSLIHGFGLVEAEGFVAQLQRWLEGEGIDAIVVNAGVSGDTTAGGAARLEWTLGEDADVLIVLFGGNDLLRGIDPAESRRNLDKILSAATDRGFAVLLIGHEAPGNYGMDYKRDFEAIFPELAEKHGARLFERFFAPLDALGERAEIRLDYMQPDGLHPNADGVGVIVEAIGPVVADLIIN